MTNCFSLNYEKEEEEDDEKISADLSEQMSDEKMALQSIYVEDEFVEQIPDKLWVLKLKLPHLLRNLPKRGEATLLR